MKNWTWSGTGAAFLVAGFFAAIVAVAEAILPVLGERDTPGAIPRATDYLYGINIHVALALCTTVLARIVAWRASERRFLLLAVGAYLVAELGFVQSYWVARAQFVPPFYTLTGKLITAAICAAGAFLGLSLTLLVARRESPMSVARHAPFLGRVGIVLAAAMVITDAFILWNMAPRSPAGRVREDANAAERPDVFILLVDTLRRDHLSFFGYARETSPNVDELLGASIVLTNAYTPSAWTQPTVTSLFTGLYPSAHGMMSPLAVLPSEAPSLAEHFRSYGYSTAAFVANPIITRRKGYAQGFDEYLSYEAPWWCYHSRTAIELIANRLWWGPAPHWPAPELSQYALDWLDANPERPRFVYLQYMDPHAAYSPPKRHRDAVAPGAPPGPDTPPKYPPRSQWGPEAECDDWQCLDDPPRLPDEQLAGMIANYDGEIRRADEGIGVLLSGLRERGLLDRSHIVFCNDHGEEFFDHRGWGHGGSVYEESVGCPLGYRPPGGVPGGTKVDRPVGLIDFAATLCTRLDMELPPLHQGRAIPELLTNAVGEAFTAVLSEQPPHVYALRVGRWKVIRRGRKSDPNWRLYDIEADRLEQTDLASVYPDTLWALRSRLEAMVAAYSETSLEGIAEITDLKELRKLRALGYIQ